MVIYCGKHPQQQLGDLSMCPICLADANQPQNAAGSGFVNWGQSNTVLIDGKDEVLRHHGIEEVLVYVPAEIHQQVLDYITNACEEQRKICTCMSCQLNRQFKPNYYGKTKQ